MPVEAMKKGSSYDPLTLVEFGAKCIELEDVDCYYTGLHGAGMDPVLRNRVILAFCLCYKVGASCYLAEQPDFWKAMDMAAHNEVETPIGGRWPRDKQRRYWRGAQAVESVRQLRARYGDKPEDFVEYCHSTPNVREIGKRVQEHYTFGKYIAWKVADLGAVVCGKTVDWTGYGPLVSDTPRIGASLFLDQGEAPANDADFHKVALFLIQQYKGLLGWPRQGKPVDLPEVETILCDWVSHRRGRYPIGVDLKLYRDQIEPWAGVSPTAAKVLAALPPLYVP